MMNVADDAKTYRVPPEERCWYDLATAIIKYAVDDYLYLMKRKLVHHANVDGQLEALMRFFRSPLFEAISTVSPPKFVAILEREARLRVHERRKWSRGERP